MHVHERRAARVLVGMGGLAVVCVASGMTGIPRLITAGAVLMMLAPLTALASVALGTLRAGDRMAGYAIGAILVIGVGMLLAY